MAISEDVRTTPARRGIGAPLAIPVFRRVWTTSILSNLGQQVLAVTAAWSMVRMQAPPSLIALVQTAAMLPVMLLALPAGAIADMYDKRKAAITALLLAAAGALFLVAISLAGLLTPPLLLAGCFVVGCGVALFAPAWQSSVGEQVGRDLLPAAVALYSVSANLARSAGPAIGGVLVALASVTTAFAITAALYLPIIVALLSWRRRAEPPRLPPEGVYRAVRAGVRYVRLSSAIRRLLIRSTIASLGASAIYAMMPLIVRDVLGAGARTYGVLLGAFGAGAVSAVSVFQPLRERVDPPRLAALLGCAMGAAILAMAASRAAWLTAAASFVAGGTWMLTTSLYNVAIQTAAPRWVAGRALAGFQAGVAGGLAFGAWGWGSLAGAIGVVPALLCAGGFLLLSPLSGRFAPIPAARSGDVESIPATHEPDVALALSGRSGPIAIELEYRVAEADARRFYHLMRQKQLLLERNGAIDVSLSRDIADPCLWVRRYHYSTWHDYLRARDRSTQIERDLTDRLTAMLVPGTAPRIRRLLERPFGSVRWTDAARDTATTFTGDL